MTTFDAFAEAFGFDRALSTEFHFFGKVDSIGSDGTLNVVSGYVYDSEHDTYDAVTTACSPFCVAGVGDIVVVVVFKGKAVAAGVRSSANSLRNSANVLINALGVGDANVTDGDVLVLTENVNATEDRYYRRPISKLWPYFKSQADTTYPMLQGATLIPENTNLNTLTEPGTYYRYGNDATATITNCPVDIPFRMTVERTIGTGYLVQRINTYYGSSAEWSRATYDGGTTWQPWYRLPPRSSDAATGNRFLATPNGSDGLPSYRAIATADLPTVPATKGGTGETTLNDSANALVNALTAATGNITNDDTYIITQNTNATEDRYYRRPISKLWTWVRSKLAPATYNVLPLITQTSTQSGNFTLSSASLVVSGYVAQLRVGFTIAAALTAGTEYSMGTLASSITPALGCDAGIGDRRAFATISSGTLYMRPEVAMSSGTTTYYFNATYILASAYSG